MGRHPDAGAPAVAGQHPLDSSRLKRLTPLAAEEGWMRPAGPNSKPLAHNSAGISIEQHNALLQALALTGRQTSISLNQCQNTLPTL